MILTENSETARSWAGAFHTGRHQLSGSIIIIISEQATPRLNELAADPSHPGLLGFQAGATTTTPRL